MDEKPPTPQPQPVTGSPADKPAFLDPARAKQMAYVGADTVPVFDHELEPLPPIDNEPLPPRGKGPSIGYEGRYRAIARLHAYGYTNNQIARHLGYSATGISLALKKPWLLDEVKRIRDQLVDPEVLTRLKLVGQDAIAHIHQTILDPMAKADIRSTNARWAIEKLTGKPKQEVSVESGTLATFTDLLRDMQRRGESLEPHAIDVTPLPALEGGREAAPDVSEEPNRWATWLDTNLG